MRLYIVATCLAGAGLCLFRLAFEVGMPWPAVFFTLTGAALIWCSLLAIEQAERDRGAGE